MKITDNRTQEILDEVTVLQHDDRTNKKKMTFAQAWATLQKQRPELFDEGTPAGQPPPQHSRAAEAALGRARQRAQVVHAARPSEDGCVTVQGGFAYDLTSGKMLVTRPDGSVVEAVSEARKTGSTAPR
jgi:hypothetical protein